MQRKINCHNSEITEVTILKINEQNEFEIVEQLSGELAKYAVDYAERENTCVIYDRFLSSLIFSATIGRVLNGKTLERLFKLLRELYANSDKND